MYIITGASRGIGEFLFKEMNKKGEKVFGIYKNTEPLELYKKKFANIDIKNFNKLRQWAEGKKNELENIILINCAGINYTSLAHKSNIDEWKEVIDTNLTGTFNVIRAILPLMREQEYGRIINLSSVVAKKGTPGASAYAASKAGLWGMTKSIAVENASKNITINNLNLGYFDIGMIDEVPEKFKSEIKNSIPSKKFGKPENILYAIDYLVKSDYINGSSVDINSALF